MHSEAEQGANEARRVGRPVVLQEQQRRGLMIDAAARLFLEKGYAATTMSAVALEARMSKKTLYQVFPSKLALFDALLEDRIFQQPDPAAGGGGGQEECLTRLLVGIAENLLRPDRTGLIRLIITDGQASPELATAFERLKMGNKLNALELWLEREMAAGAIPRGDVTEVARLLFGMTVAEPILSALLRAPPKGIPLNVEQHIRIAVGIFLRGIAGCG
jgi:AcrR family transcriptional regulator